MRKPGARSSAHFAASAGFGHEVPLPLHSLWPAHVALSPALQPLVPLQVFFPLQQSLSAGAAGSAEGTLGASAFELLQPIARPASIPVTAVTANAFPMFMISLQSHFMSAEPR